MSAPDDRAQRLIWIDLEMTGLYPERDRIIEIATLVTTADLEIVAEGPVFAIHQSDELLAGMDAWNTRQHTDSGLVARVQVSTVDEAEAEAATLAFLRQHVDTGVSPMAGNSICLDRRFLYRHMPQLQAYFHYRNLDVSTLKELAQRWAPDIVPGFKKIAAHLALQDVHDSVAELSYYRKHMDHFKA